MVHRRVRRRPDRPYNPAPIGLLALALLACGGGEVGGAGGTTGTGGWHPNHNIVPDDEPCAVPTCSGTDVANCCHGIQIADGDGDSCPGAYPNNWTCVAGQCVHGGCSTNADCVDPFLSCLDPADVAGSTKFCVRTCSDDPDNCSFTYTSMMCTGEGPQGLKYCRQHPYPE